MLKTVTPFSPKSFLESTEKAKEKAGNEIGNRLKVSVIKLVKAKKSKNLTNVKKSAKFKFQKAMSAKIIFKTKPFLILKAWRAFTQLSQAFIKAPILHHFDQKHYISIVTQIGKIIS